MENAWPLDPDVVAQWILLACCPDTDDLSRYRDCKIEKEFYTTLSGKLEEVLLLLKSVILLLKSASWNIWGLGFFSKVVWGKG